MALQYLIFDASDDGEGLGSWEAVASVRADDRERLWAEVEALRAAAEADAPGRAAPRKRVVPGTWTCVRARTARGWR
jgi:hypothetical protein